MKKKAAKESSRTNREARKPGSYVERVRRLLITAGRVMGSRDAGEEWLSSPQHGLGGEIPLEFVTTDKRYQEVEDLLGRIESGVYG